MVTNDVIESARVLKESIYGTRLRIKDRVGACVHDEEERGCHNRFKIARHVGTATQCVSERADRVLEVSVGLGIVLVITFWVEALKMGSTRHENGVHEEFILWVLSVKT